MKTSIEELFDIYVTVMVSHSIAPWDEANDIRAFFCGFNACLQLIDVMAVDMWANPDKQESGLAGLHAEFERFAIRNDLDISTNH